MSGDLDFLALAPEIVLAVTILAVLAADLVVARPRKFLTAVVGIVGLSAAAVPLVLLAVSDVATRSLLGGSFVVDDFALVLKGLFIAAGYVVILMSVSYIEADRYYEGEYFLLLLSSILGSMLMASSRDLIILFIALELTTTPLFLLAGWRKGDMRSNESALKFYVLGVLSTALLLWGMSMIFGLTGAVQLDAVREAVGSVPDEAQPLLGLAVLFTLVGFGFKVSAVPFHFWAPDTYEGAPLPVTTYLSVSSKAAGFVGIFLLCYVALPGLTDVWGPALWAMAALSMTVANLAALRQQNIVRLLAYSSIAQAGFMLVPFAAAAVAGPGHLAEGLEATVIYLLVYALMNLGAFGVAMLGIRRVGSADLDRWAGLGRLDGRLGLLVAVFFFSLAGIPPLGGWFAKFAMFRSAITAGSTGAVVLAVIAALNTVVAFYYYARVAKAVWLDAPPADARPVTRGPEPSLGLALGIAAAGTLLVGIFPAVATFFGQATRVLVAAAGG